MSFLLDPNIAYLFLLGGVFLAMLAIATPGTGLLEIVALFTLVVAGYAISNLSFNWWALTVLVLSIVPFIYAIQKPKRELYLGLSILLLSVGSIYIFPSEGLKPAVNPLLAIIASVLMAGFLWIAISKSVQVALTLPVNDLDILIGQVGEAKTKIHEEGSVQVESELWSARSEKPIKSGSLIRVLRREGFVLIVEKKDS